MLKSFAQSLFALSKGVPDPDLRRYLLRGAAPSESPALGTFPHIALWKEFHKLVQSRTLRSLTICCSASTSSGTSRRAIYGSPCSRSCQPFGIHVSCRYVHWDYGSVLWQLFQRNHSRQSRELNDAVCEKSLEDVSKGFATGTHYGETAVTELLPLPRFPVPKGTGVRAVDDGSSTGSSANLFTRMVKKLQVPSTDQVVATDRGLHRLLRAGCLTSQLPLGSYQYVQSREELQ